MATPTRSGVNAPSRSSTPVIGSPPRAMIVSPIRRPPSSAGLPGSTETTSRPLSWPTWAATASGNGAVWLRTPSHPRRMYPCSRSAATTRATVSAGTVMFSPRTSALEFTPITRPAESISGPPENPGYMTISGCT